MERTLPGVPFLAYFARSGRADFRSSGELTRGQIKAVVWTIVILNGAGFQA
jgi:hypothetical protein